MPRATGDSIREIIEIYKGGIDVTLLRETLKLTPEQRVRNLQRLQRLAGEARAAGERLRDRT